MSSRSWFDIVRDAVETSGGNAEAATIAMLIAAGVLAALALVAGLDVLRRGRVARPSARSLARSLGSSLWLIALVAVAGLVSWRTTGGLRSPRADAGPSLEPSVGTLATPPAEQREKPPLWVTEPDRDPDFAVVASRRFATVEEAEADARAELASLLDRALAERAGIDTGDWAVPADLAAEVAVRRQFVEPIRHTTAESEFVVYRVHFEAELDEQVLADVGQRYRANVVRGRLWKLGGLVGFLTVLFATVAACLRLDEATEGHYRGRLEAAAVSLVAAAGLVVAALV